MKKHLKCRNPALNVPRRHEPVATDTVFSDTPAVEYLVKQVQVFVGRDTLVADAYPMKSGKQFVNTLEDNIRRRGAMDKILSDSAKTEISNKVMGSWIFSGHITFQIGIPSPTIRTKTPAEWRYSTIKSWTNTDEQIWCPSQLLAPMPHLYVLATQLYILCSPRWQNALFALAGINNSRHFHHFTLTFYQPVFYATYDEKLPSESEERAGYWVGFGEHCGDAMIRKLLDHEVQ